ncbi:MAG: serine protease [Polyangiales bacterium]
MRPIAALLYAALALTLACAPASSITRSGQGVLPSETIHQLGRGVFEVVVPKVNDDGIKYRDPLPVELLPYGQRNDKFVGIGTAFAISPTRFVTAAHVIPAHVATSRERYYLRDSSGATHEIGQITKYSQYRDLIEFELIEPWGNVVPLVAKSNVEIGEPVLTVGNARGEGIVLRSGSITSLTHEPVAGQWKFLRFSAPASPGNSGGPLVDTAGRVLGIVVRKSEAENLNYAVPIDEVNKLSSEKSEFFLKGISISEDHSQTFVDWRFASPLPASLASLRQASRRSFSESLSTWLSEFDIKHAKDIFPNHPMLKVFLRESVVPFGLARFALDGNGRWDITRTNYTEREVAPGQKAYLSEAADKAGGDMILERPRAISLSTFFGSPKALGDALAHNYSWAITFAGQRIAVETLGEPAEKERWSDDYGRPWFTYVWELKRSDEVVVLNCLTNPAGWACTWRKVGVPLAESLRVAAKRMARRTTLSYYGNIKDWVEFLALPETYRPKLFANATVRFDKTLTFEFRPFSGQVDIPFLSETSVLFAVPSIDPSSLKEERIIDVRIVPRKDKLYSFGVQEVLEPVPQSSEKHTQFWKNLKNGSPPYDGVLLVDGKTNVIRRVAQPPKWGGGRIRTYYCRSGNDDAKAELQASCKKFQETVTVARAAANE